MASAAALLAFLSALLAVVLVGVRDSRAEALRTKALVAKATVRPVAPPAADEPVDLFWARVRAARTPPSVDWLTAELRRREVQRAVVEIRASLLRQERMQRAA